MIANTKIYLYGGGGHAKVVIDVLQKSVGEGCIEGIFDDNPQKDGQPFYNTKIIGRFELNDRRIENLFIAIGDNHIREQIYKRISSHVETFIKAIDPSANISPSAAVGEGILVMPGVCINADSIIGDHVIVNTNATIEHDCRIENFVHIAPGSTLTGGVSVGRLTLVGANATIVPGKQVGSNCLVGAGSVVTKNVPDNSFVFGNPAKIIPRMRKNA